MSMENTENLDVKPEENKEQVTLDFGNMAPDEIQELKEEPDTTGVKINLEDVGNEVSAVDGDVSKYGYWADTYFDYKVSMPLARYSVPSLQNPAEEHGDAVTINKGGTHLS